MPGRLLKFIRAMMSALISCILASASPACLGADSLADPDRLDTASDPRRITQDVILTATVDKKEFETLEPITLTVRAKCVGGSVRLPAAGYPPAAEYRTFHIRVFDASGQLLPKTRYHTFDVRYRGFPVGLSNGSAGIDFNPGKEYVGAPVANLVYDMTSPGKYTILVEFPMYRDRMVDGQAVPLVAQAEPIQVEVLAEPLRLPGVRRDKLAPKSP